MKRIAFAVVGAAALALAGCGRNDSDTLNETSQENYQTDQLNQLANNAAQDAEVEALGTQQQQLQQENRAATENTTNEADADPTDPTKVEDDVQGM
jgi:hypothetical protein